MTGTVSHPATSDASYDADQAEFLGRVATFRKEANRLPMATDMFAILRSMGYERASAQTPFRYGSPDFRVTMGA